MALRNGFDDALFYDEQSKEFLELTTSNIIFVDKKGAFFTPKGDHFLKGVPLKQFESYLHFDHKELNYEGVLMEDIQGYEYAFALNAVSLLTYIESIGNEEFNNNRSAFTALQIEFMNYLEREF